MPPASSWTMIGAEPDRQVLMCGIGFNRVHNPHDRESAYTKQPGLGPAAGHLSSDPAVGPRCFGAHGASLARRAGTSTICLPSNGASSPSIRASVFPPPSTQCWAGSHGAPARIPPGIQAGGG